MLDRLGAGDVDDRNRGGEDDLGRDHRALSDDDALDDRRARADERAVLDDHRPRLRRLEHAADADAAGEVHVRADLGARADRRPRVDHRPRADPGADVDEPRHQDDALGEKRSVSGDAGRDDAHPPLGVVVLHRDLVQEVEAADLHRLDLAQPEVEEDRLLRPVVDDPLAVALLRDARFASVEKRDRGLDRLRVELAALPDLVDARCEVHQAPSSPIAPRTSRSSVS